MSNLVCLVCLRPKRSSSASTKERKGPAHACKLKCSQYRNNRFLASSTTHASPSFRFLPVMALHLKICHRCVRIDSSSRAWVCLMSAYYLVRRSGPQPGRDSRIKSPFRPCIPPHQSCLQRQADWLPQDATPS